MNILGITIMRTRRYLAMKDYIKQRDRDVLRLAKRRDVLNAEIARLREIKAKYADLLIAHEALKAEHTRWTDRGPDGRFVGGKP